MALTNTAVTEPRPTPARPVPSLSQTSTLADVSWWLVGALIVFTIMLALVITTFIRSFTGEITLAWFVSRGAGIAGYLLLTGAMIYGLLMTTKTATSALPGPVSYGMHEFISWLGFIFITAHAVVLLWDAYIKYSPASILVPFYSTYKPIWVGLGQIAFYASALLLATFYARKRMGHRTWRLIHYASFAIFIVATLHGIFSGSDTKTFAMQAVYVSAAAVVFFLSLVRILVPRRAKSG